MLQKTYTPASRTCETFGEGPHGTGDRWERSLEFRWGPIAQGGVQSLFVVDLFQEPFEGSAGFGQVAIILPIHLFVFQGFEEGLRPSIVMGISWSAHADADVLRPQQIGVIARGVLHATIGMMHRARCGLPLLQSHAQRLQRQLVFQQAVQAQPITFREKASRITAA